MILKRLIIIFHSCGVLGFWPLHLHNKINRKMERKRTHQQRTGALNNSPPHLQSAIELLYGLDPASTTVHPILVRSTMSRSAAARVLGCTDYALRKLMTAWEEGGITAVEQLRWGTGAAFKNKASKVEIDWLVSTSSLKRQAHMDLGQRA